MKSIYMTKSTKLKTNEMSNIEYAEDFILKFRIRNLLDDLEYFHEYNRLIAVLQYFKNDGQYIIRNNLILAELNKLIIKRFNIDVTNEALWNDSHITIRKGLVVSPCSETKTFIIIENAFNLEEQLYKSEEITKLVQSDETFATELYSALCNIDWVKEGIVWNTSWRSAGGIVSNIKHGYDDEGEQLSDYLDYYLSGNEGVVSNRIASKILTLGWKYRKPID